MRVAITGGIGSGKSAVSKIIENLGYPVFSCDKIYADLFKEERFIEGLKKLFPEAIKNKQIDKAKLAQIVFANEQEREKLNAYSHPIILKRLEEKMNNCASTLVFAEVPLLFEGGFEEQFNKILVVTRSMKERIQAVQERDGLSVDQIKSRMQAQVDYDSKEMKRQLQNPKIFIIENSGISMGGLQEKTCNVINKLSM